MKVTSFAHGPPTVRVAAVEVAQLSEARQAGADAMERECRRLRKAAMLNGYRYGFAHGAWQGFCAAMAGMVLGILGAAAVYQSRLRGDGENAPSVKHPLVATKPATGS